MAVYGIATQNAAGQLYMYSPTMNGVFFNNNGTYSTNATVPSTGFVTQFGMATPISAMSAQFTSGAIFGGTINVNGGLNASSTFFYGPTAFENGGNTAVYPPNINATSTQVYAFGVPTTPTGYGFFAAGSSGSAVSIDATHKAFYIQNNADGSFIRTGTATSLSSSTSAGTSYSQPTSASITFERSFLNPPLVFITQSSGPIALNFMTRDGSGLYNGMSIVAGSSFSNQGVAGVAPYSGNTYTFSYFLVANEDPFYGVPTNYGLRVFNGLSQKIFDSAYFSPTFQNFTITKPVASLSSGTYNSTSVSFTKGSNFGVCLNNLNSITGNTVYTSQVIGSSGIGPFSLFGRFANVTPTSVVLSGTGACAVLRVNTFPTFWYNSFDYTMGNAPTMPVLFCNYPV
jgi:hypothetical protein